MQSKATTVKKYLAELPPERREAMEAVRNVILDNLPKGYEEGVQNGAIGYSCPTACTRRAITATPPSRLPFAGLASQKNYMALYLMCIYGRPEHEACSARPGSSPARSWTWASRAYASRS